LVAVIGGLILWSITRYYDKPTSLPTSEQPKPQPMPEQRSISGTVVDKDSNKEISGAWIVLVGRTEQYMTETSGNFEIDLPSDTPNRIRLRVNKTGYQPFDTSVDIPLKNALVLPLQRQSPAVHSSPPTAPVTWQTFLGSYGAAPNSNSKDARWVMMSLVPSRRLVTPAKLELNFTDEIIGEPQLFTLADAKQHPVVWRTLDRAGTKWIIQISDPRSLDYLFVKITSTSGAVVSVSCLKCPSK
jgi:hypothetical protein